MLPLRPETRTTDRVNTHLSLLFHCCFIGDYVTWVVSDLHWYDIPYIIMSQLSNPVEFILEMIMKNATLLHVPLEI